MFLLRKNDKNGRNFRNKDFFFVTLQNNYKYKNKNLLWQNILQMQILRKLF